MGWWSERGWRRVGARMVEGKGLERGWRGEGENGVSMGERGGWRKMDARMVEG